MLSVRVMVKERYGIVILFYLFFVGGIWINLGPLLYHFADIPGEKSIEPSYTAVREAITGFGFTFEVSVLCLSLFEQQFSKIN